MSTTEVQNLAVQTYNENLSFLEKYHKEIYDKLALFEAGINTQQIQPTFDLQYINNSFEIINLKTNQPFYGGNSNEISQTMVNQSFNFNAKVNSFKTFYETSYNDEFAKEALDRSIIEEYTVGNAPIIHYVQKNLPQEENLIDIHKFIIFGVGLGMHIAQLHEKIKAKLYLIVEPTLEIFRLSLFVTNYAKLSQKAALIFSIAQTEIEFRKTFDIFYGEAFVLNHYLKFFKLVDTCELYMKTIQNFLVAQSHLLYAYNRTFMSIYRTNKYIFEDYKVLNISKIQALKFSKNPILMLAAGPSLQKNINFVKENQDKFIIVAIYATLPLLEKHNIKPDIITQYDEQNNEVLNTLDKIKDISFFKEAICLFGSHVNTKLMEAFPKENILIFQAMFEQKKDFGMLTSPSIGELTYGLLLKLGAKNIYLLGLDLAMDEETDETHIEGHSGSKAFDKLKDLEDSEDTNYSYRKNTILIKGNFKESIKSIPVFKSNIDAFNTLTILNKSNDCKVYNLSNGAYLEQTIPLPIVNIDLSVFNQKITNNILNELSSISETSYNNEDIQDLTLRISAVKKSKKLLDQFYKIKKYDSLQAYKNKLFNLLHELLFENHLAPDLQKILQNYTMHTMHFAFYLFSVDTNKNFKRHIYPLNQAIYTQFNKILMTYAISISYSPNSEFIMTKKLNKLLKEFNIKETLFSEPFFKELNETSLYKEQSTYLKNGVSFFATKENLENKTFTSYIKKLIKEFPKSKITLFYFFEHQKIQATHIFKQVLKHIEFKIPKNIEEIAKVTDIWFETNNQNQTLNKTNDILLNNYSNLYPISLNENNSNPIKSHQFSFVQEINKVMPLNNSSYFNFCNSLKENIDIESLSTLYKKEHIGFFAFKENLTHDFLQAIVDIYSHFPNIKFMIFHFNENQKKLIENTFQNLLSRFEFVIPKDIYKIASTIEILISAEVKVENFLFPKLDKLFSKIPFVYPVTINQNITIEKSSYLKSLIPNYYAQRLLKSQYKLINNHVITEDSVGFSATNENIQDKNFISYINELQQKFPYLSFKIFYLNESQKESIKPLLELNTNIEFYFPKEINKVISKIQFFVYTNYETDFIAPAIINSSVIYSYRYDSQQFNYTVKDYDQQEQIKNHYLFTDYDFFGLSKDILIKYNYSYIKILQYLFLNETDLANITLEDLDIQDTDNYHDIIYFKIFERVKKYPQYIRGYKKVYQLMLEYNKRK